MKFPVDLLASVDPGALHQSAKDCMSKLLHQSSEVQESFTLSDSKEITIDLCNVSLMPLYGYDIEHKILGLYLKEDIHTAVGFHLLGKWWSFEDILRTADPSRTGLLENRETYSNCKRQNPPKIQDNHNVEVYLRYKLQTSPFFVRTPIERIVLQVLNKFIYKTKEKASNEDPFLSHREHQIAKIFWKDGEAIGFYSFIPEGTLCDSFVTQCYQLPVMDTIFIRKCHRGKGYGLQMLEDFVHTFRTNVGLKYPLPAAMYKVCKNYLSTYPADKQLLWEVRDVGAPYQRTPISKKLETMELKGHHQFVRKLDFEKEKTDVLQEKAISTPAQITRVENTIMDVAEEEVHLKMTKEVKGTPNTTLGRSGNLKRKMLGQDTEATTEKTFRVDAIKAVGQSPVREAEAIRSALNLKDTTTTMTKVACVTCVHCGKHIEQTTESEEYMVEVSVPQATVTSKASETTELLQITSNVAEIQSMKSSDETQTTESLEGTNDGDNLQPLHVRQLVEAESAKLTLEKAMEKTELLQMTSNVGESQRMKRREETQMVKSGAIGAANLQYLEVQQVEIVRELTPGTEMIKEKTEQKAGEMKDSKNEGDDKIEEEAQVICEAISFQKPSQQTELVLQPVTTGSEESSNTEMKISRRSTAASQQKSTYLHKEPQVASKSCTSKASKATTRHTSLQMSFKDESRQALDIAVNEDDQKGKNEVQVEEKAVNVVKYANKVMNEQVLREKDVQSQDDTALQREKTVICSEKIVVEELSQEGAELQKEKDSEMNVREKGDESSVVLSSVPATDVELHGTTQKLLKSDHKAISEEIESIEIEQSAAEDESEVSLGLSVMEKKNTEQVTDQEPNRDTSIAEDSKCEETNETKRRENDEELKSDWTEPIGEEDSEFRMKLDKPLKETQTLQNIHVELETGIEDASEPCHVHVGEKLDNWTVPTEDEVSAKPGTSGKHGSSRRSNHSTPVRRSGRFKDQSVKGELTKIVLRSGTKLTTAITKHRQVQHTKTVKQHEKKRAQLEDESEVKQTENIMKSHIGADLQDNTMEHSELERDSLELETAHDNDFKEVENRKEDISQDDTTGDSIKIVAVDVWKDTEPNGEGGTESLIEPVEKVSENAETSHPLQDEEDSVAETGQDKDENMEAEASCRSNNGNKATEGQMELVDKEETAKEFSTHQQIITSKLSQAGETTVTNTYLSEEVKDGHIAQETLAAELAEKHALEPVTEIALGQGGKEDIEIAEEAAADLKLQEASVELVDFNKDALKQSAEISETSKETESVLHEGIKKEPDKLNQTSVAEKEDAFTQIGVEEPIIPVTLMKQVMEPDAVADTLETDSRKQKESIQTEETDDRVEKTILNEISTAAVAKDAEKVYTSEIQEVMEADHQETVQENIPEKEIPVITSRYLMQRTVMVNQEPDKPASTSRYLEEGKSDEDMLDQTESWDTEHEKEQADNVEVLGIAVNENVGMDDVTDKDSKGTSVERDDNNGEKIETNKVQGKDSETVIDIVHVNQGGTQEQVGIEEKSAFETELAEHSFRRGKTHSTVKTPERRSGHHTDQPTTSELTKRVLRSSTKQVQSSRNVRSTQQSKVMVQKSKEEIPIITSRSLRQRTVMITAKTGQNNDEKVVAEVSYSSNDGHRTPERQVEAEDEKELASTHQEISGFEVTINKEDALQHKPTSDSVQITVMDVAEEGEGEKKKQSMEPGSEQGTRMQTKGRENKVEETLSNEEPFAELATETSKVYTREDQKVTEPDHGDSVQDNVPEEETTVSTSRSLRRRTIMVTSTPQGSESKHLQKTEVKMIEKENVWVETEVMEQTEEIIVETGPNKDGKMATEFMSRSSDGAPEKQLEVVDGEEIGKESNPHQEVLGKEPTMDKEDALQDETTGEGIEITRMDVAEEDEEKTTESLMEPLEKVGGNETYAETTQPQPEEDKLNQISVVEKEDAFTHIGVEEPMIPVTLTEQVMEPGAVADTLETDSSEQKESIQTEETDDRVEKTTSNEKSTAAVVKDAAEVYTSEIQEVIKADHQENVQENVSEEEIPVITSRSLRQRTVMVTSTPQRSKSKFKLQKTDELTMVVDKNKVNVAESVQNKDKNIEAEIISRSKNEAREGQVEVVDKEETTKKSDTLQNILTSESGQANKTTVIITYFDEGVKDAQIAQDTLAAELVEKHVLEPVTEMALVQGEKKDIEVAELAVEEAAAALTLQEASVMLVDFNKDSLKQSAEISETSNETESLLHEEVNQEPDEPASTSRYLEEGKSDEDMLDQTESWDTEPEKEQADNVKVLGIAVNENVGMDDVTDKDSKGTSVKRDDNNGKKMETNKIQGKDSETVISIVHENQGGTQESRQVGIEEKSACETELAEHSFRRGKTHSTVRTPKRRSGHHTDRLTTSKLTERVLRSSTKQVQSSPNQRSTRQTNVMVQKSKEETPVITSRSHRQRTVMMTSTAPEKSDESIAKTGQNNDEKVATEVSSRSNDGHRAPEGQDEAVYKKELVKVASTHQEIPGFKATINKENASQDKPTSDSVKITVMDVAEEGEKKEQSMAELATETSKVYTREDQKVIEPDHGDSVQENVPEVETTVTTSRGLRQRTVMVTSTPQGSKTIHLQKTEVEMMEKKNVWVETEVVEQTEETIAETGQNKDGMMEAEFTSRSSDGDKAPERQLEVVDGEQIGKESKAHLEILGKVPTMDKENALQDETTGDGIEITDMDVAKEDEEKTTESLMEPLEKVGGNETYAETTQPQQEENKPNQPSVAEKDDAFTQIGVEKPIIPVTLMEQVMEHGAVADILETDSSEQKESIQTEETDDRVKKTISNEKSTAAVAKNAAEVYTSEIRKVIEADHQENFQENIPEEEIPVISSRSLRQRTVMVTSTPQRSKSKSKLQKTDEFIIVQNKDKNIEAEVISRSNNEDKATEGQMEVVDKDETDTLQEIPTSESGQANETTVTNTYFSEGVKDGHIAQDTLAAELLEKHLLETVTEMALGQGGPKDTEIAEEAVEEAAADLILQEASVMFVDFNKSSLKQSSEFSDTSKETDSVSCEEVNQEPDKPASTSRNSKEGKSDEDKLNQTESCDAQLEKEQSDEEQVVETAVNEMDASQVGMDDVTDKISKVTSVERDDHNDGKMDTEEVQGKDSETVISIIQEIQGDTQEPRQDGEEEKSATQTELAEHSVRRGKTCLTRKTTERSAVKTLGKHSGHLTDQPATSELIERVLRSSTKQVHNELSPRQTKAMVQKSKGGQAVDKAEEEDNQKPAELPTEISIEDKIQAVAFLTEGATVVQDIKLRADDSANEEMEEELFPKHDKVTEVHKKAPKATTGKDSNKDIGTDQKIHGGTQELRPIGEEEKSATQTKLDEGEQSKKRGKAHSTRTPTERSAVGKPVRHSGHFSDQPTTSELTKRVLRSSTNVQTTPNKQSTQQSKATVQKSKSGQAVAKYEDGDKEKTTELPTGLTVGAKTVTTEGTTVLQDIEVRVQDSHSGDEEMEEDVRIELFPEQDMEEDVLKEEATTGKPSTSELTLRVLRSSTKQVQSDSNQRSSRQTKSIMQKGKRDKTVEKSGEEFKVKPSELPAELAMEDKIGAESITTTKLRENDPCPGVAEMEESSVRTELFPEQEKEDKVPAEDVVLNEATEAIVEEKIERLSYLHDTNTGKDIETEDSVSIAETGKDLEEAPILAPESISFLAVQKATVVLMDFKKVIPKQISGIEANEEPLESQEKGDKQARHKKSVTKSESEKEQTSVTETSTKATQELEEQDVLNKAEGSDEEPKLVEATIETFITQTQPAAEMDEETTQEKLTEEITLEANSVATKVEKMVTVCTSSNKASEKEDQESLTPDHREIVLENSPEEEMPVSITSRNLRRRIITVCSSPKRQSTKCLSKQGEKAIGDIVGLDKTVDNLNVVETKRMEGQMPEETVEIAFGNKALIAVDGSAVEEESRGHTETEAIASETITVEVESTTTTQHSVSVIKTTEVDDGYNLHENKDGGWMESSHSLVLEERKDLDKIPSGDDISPTNVVIEATTLTEETVEKVSEMKNTLTFSQENSTEYRLIKPAQAKSYYENSDEEEVIITKNLRRRLVTVESPLQRKSKHHCVVETDTKKTQPGLDKEVVLVDVLSQRKTSTAVVQIRETPTNSKDGSEDQAQRTCKVMGREVTTSEKQDGKSITVLVVETVETQNIGSKDMVDGASENKVEEKTTERAGKDLTDCNLQEIAPALEQDSHLHKQEEKVLDKAEKLLLEERSKEQSGRRVIEEEAERTTLKEKENIGNVSTTEEVFCEFEEGLGDGKRLLRKRTVTPTKVTTERKSKRTCKQSDVKHFESALSMQKLLTEQRVMELTVEKEKEMTGKTEQKTVEDSGKDGREMLLEKAQDHENLKENYGEANMSSEKQDVVHDTGKDLSAEMEIKKGGKCEEQDGGIVVETVKAIKELNEKNTQEFCEISLAPDESFILQLEEEDENNGPKESSVIEEMEVSLVESSKLASKCIQKTDQWEQHATEEKEGEKDGKEVAVKAKRVPKGRSSVIASPQQISTRQNKRFLQDSEIEGKLEAVKEKAVKDVTEEQYQLKRKAIADTPRRSKRLATPKSV